MRNPKKNAVTVKECIDVFKTCTDLSENPYTAITDVNFNPTAADLPLLMAPAGISKPLVARLNAATNLALRDAEVREQLSRTGAEPLGGSPEEFAATIAKDIERWKKVVAAGSIKVE